MKKSNSKKVILKHLLPPKKTQLNFELTIEELAQIRSKAERFTGGNISAWVRYAAMHLEPKQADVAEAG